MFKGLLSFLVGIISGIIAYCTSYIGDLFHFGFLLSLIPGFIFGFFSVGYFWFYTRSYMKSISWFVASWLSYIAAFRSGFYIYGLINYGNNLITYILVYSIAGIIGSSILLFSYRFFVSKIRFKFIVLILILSGFIPGILLLIFDVKDPVSFIGIGGPEDYYDITMMSFWQGTMVFLFRLLLIDSFSKKSFKDLAKNKIDSFLNKIRKSV